MSVRIGPWIALTLAGVSLGCGTDYRDPIVASNDDPCAQWSDEISCRGDLAHQCAFEPNVVGCTSSDPDCPAGTCRGGVPFVRRSLGSLFLHDVPYRFVGAVSWSLAGSGAGCRIPAPYTFETGVVKSFDELAVMRANVLKFWAFQSYAGPTGDDFTAFDRVVAEARRAGIRLVFVLENYWDDCTEGGQKTDAWFESGYRSPYGNYALSYADYVSKVVSHFANEPTVLAWEIMHEASGTDFTVLRQYVASTVAQIRELDGNHLVIVGLDGGYSEATSREGVNSNFQVLNDYGDLVDIHDFDHPDAAVIPGLTEQASIARTLQTPWFLGAVAVDLSGETTEAYALRAQRMEAKILHSFEDTSSLGIADGAGFLAYDYELGWTALGAQFDGRNGEPLAGAEGVIARHSIPLEP
jgi:hypothetical protein